MSIDLTWSQICGFVGCPIAVAFLLSKIVSYKKQKTLQGKVVLVTGANSGLGEACAKAFYSAGCKVILAGRKKEELLRVKDDLESIKKPKSFTPEILLLDLNDLENIPSKVDEAKRIFGSIDVLVNNAGISSRGSVMDISIDVHRTIMTVNYLGQVQITKAVLKHFLADGGGTIVGVSSVQGKMSIPHRSAYGASKHAFEAFLDSLRAEVSDKNIDVCIISPSYIKTNLGKNALHGDGSKHGALDKSIESGMSPEYVAERILSSVIKREKDVIIGPIHHKIAIYLRTVFPSLYFYIMAIRAKSGDKD